MHFVAVQSRLSEQSGENVPGQSPLREHLPENRLAEKDARKRSPRTLWANLRSADDPLGVDGKRSLGSLMPSARRAFAHAQYERSKLGRWSVLRVRP